MPRAVIATALTTTAAIRRRRLLRYSERAVATEGSIFFNLRLVLIGRLDAVYTAVDKRGLERRTDDWQ